MNQPYWSNETGRARVAPEIRIDEQPSGKRTVETHLSYGQVFLSRWQGSGSYLYGSDFLHRHGMRLVIAHSERERSLSQDWYHSRREIVEISLTEAQWAALICSAGVGEGVPCTIEHVNGVMTPGLPKPAARTDQFQAEMAEDFAEARALLDQLQASVESGGGGKRERLSLIGQIRQRLGGNQTFVAKQFGEAHGRYGLAGQERDRGPLAGEGHLPGGPRTPGRRQRGGRPGGARRGGQGGS